MHRLSDIKVTSRRYIACKLLKSRFLVIFQKKENREKSGNFKNRIFKGPQVPKFPEIFPKMPQIRDVAEPLISWALDKDTYEISAGCIAYPQSGRGCSP